MPLPAQGPRLHPNGCCLIPEVVRMSCDRSGDLPYLSVLTTVFVNPTCKDSQIPTLRSSIAKSGEQVTPTLDSPALDRGSIPT